MRNTYDYANYYDAHIPPKPKGSEAERKEVKTAIKACILTRKGGMPISEIRDEYQKCTGEDVPYLRIGYTSFFHLIRDMPDVKSTKNDYGEHVLVVKPNPRTQHLHKLISKQKDPRVYSNREPRRRERVYREKRNRQTTYDDQRRSEGWYSSISSASSTTNESVDEKLPPVDENTDRPLIFTSTNIDKNICTEPIVGEKAQLMGDDFFLQLCMKYLPHSYERKDPKSAITLGTVQSGMTIRKAIKRLDNMNVLSSKMIINLGTVDVYNRRTSREMINDYKMLLDKLNNKFHLKEGIVLCTIPPLGNINFHGQLDQFVNYTTFNNWLRNFAKSENYKLLDFFEEFTTDKMTLDYEMFQQDARMVSGTIHPHLLWNYFGRQKAMKLLLNA